VFLAVTREHALDQALAYLKQHARKSVAQIAERHDSETDPAIREFYSLEEIPGRLPNLYGLKMPLQDCWIAYVNQPLIGLRAATIILINKESGDVVYYGSANDEG
jgi:hypothetical protein